MQLGHSTIMKFLLSITVVFLSFGLSALAESEAGPFQVHAATGWSVKYQGDNGVQLYSITRPPQEGFILLMFSRKPGKGNREQIAEYIDYMAKGFPERVKKNPMLKLDSERYTKEEFKGDSFSGEFVVFTFANGAKQAMFMFGDSDEAWSGQYSGPSERWLEALEILKAIKKNG
jgi:hypothetical protein